MNLLRLSVLARVLLLGTVLGPLSPCQAAWTVQRLGHITLGAPIGTHPEMSGLTYLGPAPTAGLHRFAAATETSGSVALLDVAFAADGTLTLARTAGSAPIADTFDFEGIATTDPTSSQVWMVEESTPALRQYDLSSGALLQTAALPTPFFSHVPNKSLESLTFDRARGALWSANEEALTIDGPIASTTAGTTVRLLRWELSGSTATPATQVAYPVEPVHAPGIQPQSGLSDLVALPDGTLLALERSFAALATPTFLSRIYEIDWQAATDVSTPDFAGGLAGQSYLPAGKQLLWSGTADGAGGQNLEGLALGPQLDDGRWTLVGVVDDGDPFSNGILVAFVAEAPTTADFDQDGAVTGADLLSWQRGFAQPAPGLSGGDANRDGRADGGDLAIWEQTFGPPPLVALPIPEPSGLTWVGATLATLWHREMRHRAASVAARRSPPAE